MTLSPHEPANSAESHPARRCACHAFQSLRWETPNRRMYSCEDCGIWWEELIPAPVDGYTVATEPVEEEPANTNVG